MFALVALSACVGGGDPPDTFKEIVSEVFITCKNWRVLMREEQQYQRNPVLIQTSLDLLETIVKEDLKVLYYANDWETWDSISTIVTILLREIDLDVFGSDSLTYSRWKRDLRVRKGQVKLWEKYSHRAGFVPWRTHWIGFLKYTNRQAESPTAANRDYMLQLAMHYVNKVPGEEENKEKLQEVIDLCSDKYQSQELEENQKILRQCSTPIMLFFLRMEIKVAI